MGLPLLSLSMRTLLYLIFLSITTNNPTTNAITVIAP
jgi:hypothetical protein